MPSTGRASSHQKHPHPRPEPLDQTGFVAQCLASPQLAEIIRQLISWHSGGMIGPADDYNLMYRQLKNDFKLPDDVLR